MSRAGIEPAGTSLGLTAGYNWHTPKLPAQVSFPQIDATNYIFSKGDPLDLSVGMNFRLSWLITAR